MKKTVANHEKIFIIERMYEMRGKNDYGGSDEGAG